MIDLKKITSFSLDSKYEGDGVFLPFADNIILMQYTGLKDKNGKEIYEGDILEEEMSWGEKLGGKVVFGNNELGKDSEGITYTTPGFSFKFKDGSGFACLDGELEVLGSIYENPELVK